MTPSGIARRSESAGFSLVETMIVLAIIGILVNLAVPVYKESRLRAQSAAIIGDAHAVRTAVSNYYLTHDAWPADAQVGVQPPELDSFLDDQILWSAEYEYDYDYFADSEGNPTQPDSGVLVGFSVRNADPRLIALIRAAEPGAVTETWGNGVTFVIQATDSPLPIP